MPYRVSFAEDPPAALRRCAREEIEHAIEQLERRHDADPVEAVHEARKSIKKTRAVLRLARPDLDKRSYRDENRSLRDAGRAVSAVRDADVMLETVDGLNQRFVGQVPTKAFASVRRGLASQAQVARELDEAVVAQLVDDLNGALRRVDDWPLDGVGWKTIRRATIRSYRRARKAGGGALRHPTAQTLHEWRKRVKDLWYHQRLLEEAWPAVMGAQAQELHALSDALGEDHDLAVLADHLSRDPESPAGESVGADEILELAARRRAELLEAAAHQDRRLFAESPKAYGRRLKRYLKAAVSEEASATA
ncbi:MAG: CHAD domain-containing protein [Actinomycetota bacterium]|nr:CHAD domain-containing protein [Actinomycetota bacterium]